MDSSFTMKRSCGLTACDNLKRLFSELRGTDTTPDIGRINSLISSGRLAFYLAEDHDGNPVGMVSVIPCRTAASDKLWIEDVCILSDCRGNGLGRKLLEFAMDDALEFFGPGTFWLTSRPSRIAARKLYKSLGFNEYETGVFHR